MSDKMRGKLCERYTTDEVQDSIKLYEYFALDLDLKLAYAIFIVYIV